VHKRSPFCFIHIEKAGGSTIHNWFKYYLPTYVSLHPWYYWSNEIGNHLTVKELGILSKLHPNIAGFGGHTTRHYLDYHKKLNSNINYITFLRDPIARYLSNYQYQREVMGIEWTLDEYLNETKFNNFMTVRIAGNQDVDKAIDEIENRFAFVGLVEKFDESVLLICQILGLKSLKPYYERINEGDKESKIIFEDLPENVKTRIVKNNELDIKLYDRVKTNIFPRQSIKFAGDLDVEVEKLKAELKVFKYNKLRRNLIRFFKGYNHYITEPIAHTFK